LATKTEPPAPAQSEAVPPHPTLPNATRSDPPAIISDLATKTEPDSTPASESYAAKSEPTTFQSLKKKETEQSKAKVPEVTIEDDIDPNQVNKTGNL
jgi:hypothetical protein